MKDHANINAQQVKRSDSIRLPGWSCKLGVLPNWVTVQRAVGQSTAIVTQPTLRFLGKEHVPNELQLIAIQFYTLTALN